MKNSMLLKNNVLLIAIFVVVGTFLYTLLSTILLSKNDITYGFSFGEIFINSLPVQRAFYTDNIALCMLALLNIRSFYLTKLTIVVFFIFGIVYGFLLFINYVYLDVTKLIENESYLNAAYFVEGLIIFALSLCPILIFAHKLGFNKIEYSNNWKLVNGLNYSLISSLVFDKCLMPLMILNNEDNFWLYQIFDIGVLAVLIVMLLFFIKFPATKKLSVLKIVLINIMAGALVLCAFFVYNYMLPNGLTLTERVSVIAQDLFVFSGFVLLSRVFSRLGFIKNKQ